MATEDNALTPQEQAKLKAFAQGLPDNPGEIDVDAIAQETGTSRRQVLQIIAAVGVGSIAGGVSVSQLISEAQAQASTSDSDGNVGTPADRVDLFADGIDANGAEFNSNDITGVSSLSTEEANVTNETFISATRSSSANNVSAGTRTNIVDTQNIDNRGEFNSNQQFTPDKSGWYRIYAHARFGDGSDGDRYIIEVEDVNSSSVISTATPEITDSSGNPRTYVALLVELTSGTTYQVRAANSDSQYSLFGGSNIRIVREILGN